MTPERAYYTNGQIRSEIWKNDTGDCHRLDGPAIRYWYEGGQLEEEAWCINGEVHRIDGPAYRSWCENGQLYHEFWYINGVRYETEAEYLVAVDLYKANEIAELF